MLRTADAKKIRLHLAFWSYLILAGCGAPSDKLSSTGSSLDSEVSLQEKINSLCQELSLRSDLPSLNSSPWDEEKCLGTDIQPLQITQISSTKDFSWDS